MQMSPQPLIPARSNRSLAFLGLALLVTIIASLLGSSFTTPLIPTWYAALNKPWFNPPNLVFPIVWPILFTLMAVGFWRVLRRIDGGQPRVTAIVAFCVQLLFNVGWSFAFFASQSPFAGMFVATGLVLAVAAMILTFWRTEKLSALLQIPYLCWVSFALFLNIAIWRIN